MLRAPHILLPLARSPALVTLILSLAETRPNGQSCIWLEEEETPSKGRRIATKSGNTDSRGSCWNVSPSQSLTFLLKSSPSIPHLDRNISNGHSEIHLSNTSRHYSMSAGGSTSKCLWTTRCIIRSQHPTQYVEWTRTTRKPQATPLDGGPKRLRTVIADVEKQQAVVEAFRVSLTTDYLPSGY